MQEGGTGHQSASVQGRALDEQAVTEARSTRHSQAINPYFSIW